MKNLVFLFLAFIFILASQSSEAQNQRFVPDRILLKLKKEPSENAFQEILKLHGAQSLGTTPKLKIKILKVPAEKLESTILKLQKNSDVEFAEKDWMAEPSLFVSPNDPYYTAGYEWHLNKINAVNAWSLSTGSTAIPIAIVDTGVDLKHPDLASKIIQGYNIYANTSNPSDDLGHGTAVAGTAAALSNNSLGVASISWKSPLMPLKISDPTGYATYSNMAKGIIYAVDHGVRVINISFGGRTASSTLQNAVNYAWQKNAIVVAAAGNDSSTVSYPAACKNTVAVSATLSNDSFASFSNYGSAIAVSAPGKGIYTTMKGGGYGSWYGTSFSSPIVAGVAALILSLNPQLTSAQVVDILKKTSDDLGSTGYDVYFGYGRVNAYRALQQTAAISK
jgi:thermitase